MRKIALIAALASLGIIATPAAAGSRDNDHEDEIESPCDLIKGGRQGIPQYQSGRDWCIPPAE